MDEKKQIKFDKRVEAFVNEVNDVQEKHKLRLVIKQRSQNYMGVEELLEPETPKK